MPVTRRCPAGPASCQASGRARPRPLTSEASTSPPSQLQGGTAMSTIAVQALTKRYGTVTAVSDLSFELAPARITGFLGPNGAGKSTTIWLLLGLAEPTSGRATINGRPYRELRDPLRHIGALTGPDVFHPGRSGRTALRIAARPARIGGQRVEEVLELVGLGGAARRRAGGYSQGMRQRLALAAALLGDPQTLILDEPASGLDPAGVHWLRGLLRGLARRGTHRVRVQPPARRTGPERR